MNDLERVGYGEYEEGYDQEKRELGRLRGIGWGYYVIEIPRNGRRKGEYINWGI